MITKKVGKQILEISTNIFNMLFNNPIQHFLLALTYDISHGSTIM